MYIQDAFTIYELVIVFVKQRTKRLSRLSCLHFQTFSLYIISNSDYSNKHLCNIFFGFALRVNSIVLTVTSHDFTLHAPH